MQETVRRRPAVERHLGEQQHLRAELGRHHPVRPHSRPGRSGRLSAGRCARPTSSLYEECTDDNGNPSSIQDFGGTSQSSPLTAGAAALVIEAYENTHHGVRPTPGRRQADPHQHGHGPRSPGLRAGRRASSTRSRPCRRRRAGRTATAAGTTTGSALVVDKTQLDLGRVPELAGGADPDRHQRRHQAADGHGEHPHAWSRRCRTSRARRRSTRRPRRSTSTRSASRAATPRSSSRWARTSTG